MDNSSQPPWGDKLRNIVSSTLTILKKAAKDRPALFLVISLIIILYFFNLYSKLSNGENPYQNLFTYTSKVLLVFDARLDNKNTPQAVIMRFNYPVSVHELSHKFSISPNIPGKLVADSNEKNVVYYKFTTPYTETTTIGIFITQGLVSENHKTLLNDFETYLTRKPIDENTTNYSYQMPNERVQSYTVGKPIPIQYDALHTRIYRSNANELLKFLTYTSDTKERGSIYSGEYIHNALPYFESQLIKNVKVDKKNESIYLDPGVYYVMNNRGPYFIIVSRFGVTFRQDDKKVIFGVFDVEKGNKINDRVVFGLYNLKDSVNLLTNHVYSEAENTIPLEYPTKLDAVIGIYHDEVVFVPVEILNSNADINVSSNLDTDYQIFLYTDRPIYKPGDTVFVSGVVRQDSDSMYQLPPTGSTVYLSAYSYDASSNSKTTRFLTTVNEYGAFSTNFKLPAESESQYSYVQASLNPPDDSGYYRSSTMADFEVLKYTKPSFEIKTSVNNSEYLRSEKVQFKISGNYFNNKPLTQKEVAYTIYTDNYYEVEKAVYNKNFNVSSPGGMCGVGGFTDYYGTEYKKGHVKLTDQGEAVVEISLDKDTLLSQKFTLLATATDGENEIVSAVNTIVHASEQNIFFIPSSENYTINEEVVVPFYIEKLNGDKSTNLAVSYKLIDYDYNERNKDEQIVTSGTVTTDEQGRGIVRFTFPKNTVPGNRQLVLNAKDAKNNPVENQKNIYIYESREAMNRDSYSNRISQTYLSITSSQNSFTVNDTVNLTINSPKDLDALVTFERGRIYNPRFIHLHKGQNALQFPVSDQLSPSITVVFSFFIDGEYFTEGLALNVPAMHKLLNIQLSSNKKMYTPNETAELTIKTTDAQGTPVAAQMSLGVIDKAIYALRKSATPPIHSSFYYFRPRSTNASSSLTGIGFQGGKGGGGGGGGGGAGSSTDVLYWDPNVKTDSNGDATVRVPLLGHTTTWKAQILGSTTTSDVGQADLDFVVTSQVQGVKTNVQKPNKTR